MDCRARLILLALMLMASAARAQTPLFDLHVHLWNGEASLREYEAQVKAQRLFGRRGASR